MKKTTQINDFRKEIPGEVDADDKSTYKFPRITSKRFDGKESYYDIIVRIATGVASNIKGAKEIEKLNETFIDIDDKYFTSSEKLPDGYYGWYKVNYYAVVGSDPGKGQIPTRVYVGKNVGKKNQTNPFTQALRDALSRYNKQIQKSQIDVVADEAISIELYPPMLAGGDASNIDSINFTEQETAVRIQPKLNGTRGVACLNVIRADANVGINDEKNVTEVILYTRKRKLIKGLSYMNDEIYSALTELTSSLGIKIRLDGEFYVHGVPLELISGAMRREKGGEKTELKLQYHIFDIFSESKPDALFTERLSWMMMLKEYITKKEFQYLKIVNTEKVSSLDEINTIYKGYLTEGYEGVIVRLDREYKYSYNDRRARWLMKKKPVLDAEFEIVGYEGAEKGKASGWLILNLKTKEGKIFNLSNFGERGDELRQKMYEEMSKIGEDGKTIFESQYKGKFITVLFDEWSRFKVPLRARTEGIVIRDYE